MSLFQPSRNTIWGMVFLLFFTAFPVLAQEPACESSPQECLDYMLEKFSKHGWLGVEIDKDAMAGKWQLKKVFAQSPADLAGLREGDWISGVEDLNFDREWSEIQDAYKKLIRPGNAVLYHVERNGEKLSIRVTLTTMPLDVQDRFIGHHMRVYHAKTLPPSP